MEYQSDWQWENVYESYCLTEILFSEISGPVQSVRSAFKALKLYPGDSIMDTILTEANQYAAKFTETQGYTETMIPCPQLER